MTVTDASWLEVNGVALATHAYRITDLSPLLNDGGVRGSDLVIPLVAGVRPYPRRRTVRVVTLPVDIFGDVDVNGTRLADPMQGAIDHMIYLATHLGIGEDATADDGTVVAVWHHPDGGLMSASVHVLGLLGTTDLGGGRMRTTLDLSFPAGGFAAVVSS